MAVKMSFRDSKDINGRGRSSRNGGDNVDSNEGGRVRLKKGRSFGNGDEGMSSKGERARRSSRSFGNGDEGRSSKDERGRGSFKGGNSGTERRDSSSRKARDSSRRSFGNGGGSMNSNSRGRISIGRSSGNGDGVLNFKDRREGRSMKGQSSRTERRDGSSRNEMTDSDDGEEIQDNEPRNGRVNVRKSRSSGNGDGDRRSVSMRKTRSSGNGDENINLKDQRGRRSEKGHGSRNERRDQSNRVERADFDNGEELKVRGVKQGLKSRKNENKDVGNELQTENVGLKKKRVYANENLGEIETTKGKSMLKFARNEVRVLKEKRMEKEKFEILSAENSLTGQKNDRGSEAVEKRSVRSKLKGKTIVEDEGMDGTYKREGREKTETRKKLVTSSAENKKKSANKNFGTKKVVGNDKDEEADQPKKKKRMRIDPYDFSNKRMDDGLIAKDGEEKKKDLPKPINTAELSMNAQFRAICPSQSILSYVEDNLLGRRREIEIKRAGYNIDLSFPLDNIPFSTSSERERIEEPAFRNKLEFFAAAKQSSSFPPLELPEIAFAGRSNVGKSSMLNALTRQWGVVRTSDKPGLTQSINFFKLGSKLCLVDLPGYGFAYAKEEAKEAWEELVKEYVSTRVGLKRVCLLVDTKWGMKQRDYELVDLMERSKTKYQIVLTKTDLVFPVDVARRAMQIEESLKGKKSAVQPAMMVSSRSGAGIRSFRTALSKIARFLKP